MVGFLLFVLTTFLVGKGIIPLRYDEEVVMASWMWPGVLIGLPCVLFFYLMCRLHEKIIQAAKKNV